ncbi:MAG TPA: CbiQ family ECF transporter T component, partial [Thermodesulfovibrionales bacterium]|nr:CbiQ family ECF transporter T component [Thermodesulfovibrionales bacterium]
MELPQWLRATQEGEAVSTGEGKDKSGDRHHLLAKHRSERFLDKTMRHAVSFMRDVMFQEGISLNNGLLQSIEPRLKLISLLILIITLSFQREPGGIAIFLLLSVILVVMSRIPPYFFFKKLLPAIALTGFIAIPAVLNLVVDGKPLLTLHRFGGAVSIGPVNLPAEVAITEQGIRSAVTLLLRVVTSVSMVFLLTMTSAPNRLMKGLSAFFPGFLKSVVSISYRYIFFLLKKVEQFIMGFRSRNISSIESPKGRHWIASRVALLFSISMDL